MSIEEPRDEWIREEAEDTPDTVKKRWKVERDPVTGEPVLKDRYAMALSYDLETGKPKVTALGRGRFARKIEETAEKAGVWVERNPEKAEKLFRPTDNTVIPTHLYGLIAEILTFIYQLDQEYVPAPPEEEEELEEPEEGEEELSDWEFYGDGNSAGDEREDVYATLDEEEEDEQ